MLEKLKHQVYKANMKLVEKALVIYTWGNVSAIDRELGLVVIKPSGISPDDMIPADMVVVDLDGNVVDGELEPSKDLPTHLALYENFKFANAIVHSHSEYATSWAQAGMNLPPLGVTHANFFKGEVPCTRPVNQLEVSQNIEDQIGKIIVETFEECQIDHQSIPGVLVNGHGPFCWGKDVSTALDHAIILEQVARIAHHTLALRQVGPIKKQVMEKYYIGD